MEVLILVLVGVIDPLIAPVISVIGALFGGMVSSFITLIVELIGMLFRKRSPTTKGDPPTVAAQKSITAVDSFGKKISASAKTKTERQTLDALAPHRFSQRHRRDVRRTAGDQSMVLK